MADRERTVAQPQCAKFLNIAGICEKHRDGIKCPRCYHTVISATEAGVFDYWATIRAKYGQRAESIIVEVKDGPERFSFGDIQDDQWEYGRSWQHRTGGTAYFWVLMGTDRIGAKTSKYPTNTFFVPIDIFSDVKKEVEEKAGIKNIPLNDLAAKTRISTRELNLTMEHMLDSYIMEWLGNNTYIPKQWSDFYEQYEIDYTDLKRRATTDRRTDSTTRNMAAITE